MISFFKKLGNSNDQRLKKYYKLVNKINELEPAFEALSDQELKQQTETFKERLANGETIDDLKVEAFAVVREAAKRVLGERFPELDPAIAKSILDAAGRDPDAAKKK